MPYPTFDYETNNPDEWNALFVKRAQPTLTREWSWCPGSFTDHRSPEGTCLDCSQKTEQLWDTPVQKAHFTIPIVTGLYILELGLTDRAPGAPRLKIGHSMNVVKRVHQHLHDKKHQRCIVHHCFPVSVNDLLSWQIPETLENLLNAHMILKGAVQPQDASFDYFTWEPDLLEICRGYLTPALVQALEQLIE